MTTELGRLGREIVARAGDIEAAMCRWLGLVAEFDRRSGWAEEGCRSCAQWISWRCALSPAAARDRVRVARRLEELPLVREAFTRGELTYSKVRALTRMDGVAREAELVELALNATAAQLERMVGAYRRVVATADGAQAAHERRFVSWSYDDDGSLLIRGRLTAEDGAVLVQALETLRDDRLRRASAEARDGGAGESPEPVADPVPVRNADALVALVEAGVSASDHGRTGGERFQVVVHVDAATLIGEDDGVAEVAHGPVLAAATARRLACDASVVRVLDKDGRPLSVGRKTRSIPPAVRRALRARDGGCQFPGCDSHRHVDAHHIDHWAHGGETKLSNLLLLCRHHHRLLHEGGYSVDTDRNRFVFRGPDGRVIPRRLRAGVPCRQLPPRASAEAPLQRLYDRMDLGLCVDALLRAAPIEEPRGDFDHPS